MAQKYIYVAYQSAGPYDSNLFRRCCVSPPNLLKERGFAKTSFFMQEKGLCAILMEMKSDSEPKVIDVLGNSSAMSDLGKFSAQKAEERLVNAIGLRVLQIQGFALENHLGIFRLRNWTEYDIVGAITGRDFVLGAYIHGVDCEDTKRRNVLFYGLGNLYGLFDEKKKEKEAEMMRWERMIKCL